MAPPHRRQTLQGVTTTVKSAGPDVRYVALGALGAAGGRLARLARGAFAVTDAVARPVAGAAFGLLPGVVQDTAVQRVAELDAAGRTIAGAGIDAGARLADAVADRVATEPRVIRAIGDVVGEVQGRMLDSILPDVLDRLAADPDQVRAIVRGQSRGMVDEATHVARSRAVAGDEIVDRLAARILRRQPSRRVIPEQPARGEIAPADGPPPAP
jgi:hypothetical protein